jgi:hypothetical protein
MVKIVTTQNEYLSISGFEAYTGSAGGSTTTTKTTTSSTKYNTRLTFNRGSARQSTTFGRFDASQAWSNGPRFTHTKKGVGQWWSAEFNGQGIVDRVRVLNRRGSKSGARYCCPNRLGRTKVMVDN